MSKRSSFEVIQPSSYTSGLTQRQTRTFTRQVSQFTNFGTIKGLATDGAITSTFIVEEDIGSVPGAAMFGAILNCCNTILGAGTLAVPAAINLAGVLVYEVLLVLIFIATLISLRWLIDVVDVLPEGVPCNYEGIAGSFLPPAMAIAITGAFMVSMFALSMSYMLFISTSLAPIFARVLSDLPSKDDVNAIERNLLIVIGLVVVLPLCLLRDISRLKAASLFANVALLYSASYVVWSGSQYVLSHDVADGFKIVNLSSGIAVCAAMTFSAFSCHISAMPIYKSLGPSRTPSKMITILTTSLVVAATLYHIVGYVGYMRFGSKVESNILASFTKDSGNVNAASSLASVGIAGSLMCGMPLVMWPLRSCTISVWRAVRASSVLQEPSNTEWRTVTVALVSAVLIAARLVPDIKKVMGLGSAVGMAFIIFIYPSAFYLAVVKQVQFEDWFETKNAPQLVMMGMGVLSGSVCFMVALASILRP